MVRSVLAVPSFALVVYLSLPFSVHAASQEDQPTPLNKQECYEECNYRWGRAIEACSRKKDPAKREQCYANANNRYAQCKRDCDKNYPED